MFFSSLTNSSLHPGRKNILLLSIIVIQLACGLWTLIIGLKYQNLLSQSLIARNQMYPLHLSVPSQVTLTYAEDENFLVEGAQAEKDWMTLIPPGGGHVWVGNPPRRQGVGLFHDLHCLNQLRRAVIAADTGPHTRHCLNYVRQAILCHADPTMEISLDPGIGTNVTHVCRDWNQLYEAATDNYRQHLKWKEDNEEE